MIVTRPFIVSFPLGKYEWSRYNIRVYYRIIIFPMHLYVVVFGVGRYFGASGSVVWLTGTLTPMIISTLVARINVTFAPQYYLLLIWRCFTQGSLKIITCVSGSTRSGQVGAEGRQGQEVFFFFFLTCWLFLLQFSFCYYSLPHTAFSDIASSQNYFIKVFWSSLYTTSHRIQIMSQGFH